MALMNRARHAMNPPRLALRRALWGAFGAVAVMVGCAAPVAGDRGDIVTRVTALLPTDVILLGEQHDAPDHQRIAHDMVQALATQGVLAALAVEMAEAGHSTAGLAPDASAEQVRDSLHWDDRLWPWRAYGPAIMAAVHAGIPVAGANLPRAQMRSATDDIRFDMLLPGPALKAQQQLIRAGHCGLLPETRITPMTRVQIARDLAMANTVSRLLAAGKTVLLLAGSGHVDRELGVPQHLPGTVSVQSIGLLAPAELTAAQNRAKFNQVWPAQPAPEQDHCAEFQARTTASPPSPPQ
jgi:uncharacterized iron-regulated protein